PDICSCLCRYVLDHSLPPSSSFLFSCIHSPPTEIYTLSLHALFRSRRPAVVHNPGAGGRGPLGDDQRFGEIVDGVLAHQVAGEEDRKSTRLNSSHVKISYAVFCLKKKKSKGTRQLLCIIQKRTAPTW